MTIHLNQISFLHEKLSAKFPSITWEKIHNLKLEDSKYRQLLAMCYNNDNLGLDSELVQLGVLN